MVIVKQQRIDYFAVTGFLLFSHDVCLLYHRKMTLLFLSECFVVDFNHPCYVCTVYRNFYTENFSYIHRCFRIIDTGIVWESCRNIRWLAVMKIDKINNGEAYKVSNNEEYETIKFFFRALSSRVCFRYISAYLLNKYGGKANIFFQIKVFVDSYGLLSSSKFYNLMYQPVQVFRFGSGKFQ